MPGLGGSSRDDARPFIYPSMKGMGEREKVMRGSAEKAKGLVEYRKGMKFAKQSQAAYQSGAYALGAKRAAQAKDRKLRALTHTFRYNRYTGKP